MQAIERSEILPLGEYERIRERFRARVIEDKRRRRVAVGEHISVVFENRDTVMMQIQEMLRTERITSEPGILHEIETYNELLPGDNQLSVTLFVEIPDKETRERMLRELAGLEDSVALEVAGTLARASGKRQGAEPDRTTAVHYLKIDLPEAAVDQMKAGAEVALLVDHPRYSARAVLPPETRASLAADLGSR
jgi:hypothetical protein